jgi:methyl-accepting chemotaxis protein
MKSKSSKAKSPGKKAARPAKSAASKSRTPAKTKTKTKVQAKTQALTHPRVKVVTSAHPAAARSMAKTLSQAELKHEVELLRAHTAAIRKLRAYVELSPAAEIMDCNDRFEALLGIKRAEVIGRPLSNFMDSQWVGGAEAKAFWEALRSGEAKAGQHRFKPADGRELWLQSNYNPVVVDGRVVQIAVYASDVTDQVCQLSDLSGQIDAIAKSQAVIHFTLDGHILGANQNFLEATGYKLEEIVGKHHAMFVDADYRESAEYRQFWAKLGRGEYDSGQYARVAKGGRRLWLQASYNAILDPAGKPIKVVKYASDVTEQVMAAQSLHDSVEQTQVVLSAATAGDLSRRIGLEGKSGMIRSLCEGVNGLLDRIEQSRMKDLALAAENDRIKQGLDVVATNVMVADADYNVVYLNDSIRVMLAAAEGDIRKDLPNFSAAKVLGSNIDVFHKNPAYQRGMLDRLSSAHRTSLRIGGRTFNLIVNPIMGANGERLGMVVEWKDMTAELAAAEREKRVAAETQRIKQGLDVVATNVMVADADYNVVYLNDSIRVMLAEAESDIRKDLPNFSATKVLGSNIDVFHKNPAYQRGMLDRLKSAHRTSLRIGGRTFNLIVNPILGENAERLGMVVEWKDMTAELAAAEREKRVSDENLRIRMALDNVNTNVMIANKDREVIYVNKSIMQMLTRAESDLRKDLPQFDVRKVVGANIDIFHKNPAHQKHILENLRETVRSQIKVGGRTFSLVVNPIINEGGERLGTVVEWMDRTAEISVEAEVGGIVQAAANGDFTRRVNLEGKDGFFRQLADSINQLLDANSVGLNEVARVLAALAQGDLTQSIDGDFKGTFGKLKDDANRTVDQLTQIVVQIKGATDTINVAAREIASGNSDLSARTENQAASLEETASSMEQLTSTVKQNAENAKQANQLAVGASDVARKGGQVVSEVVHTMSAINESSKKIVDIISVIDGIAFQTNILALNAAVEAARAGEQGRGFAVVAAEVRSLAQRSAGAAKEIKTLIGDSVEKVGNGSKLVEQAGKTMDEIVTSVKRVTDIMAEITAASLEQSQGIEQVNATITQMDEVTQQNAALVEEASAAARSLEEQAQGLQHSVSQFQLDQRFDNATAVRPSIAKVEVTPARQMPNAKPASRASLPIQERRAGQQRSARPSNAEHGSGEQWTEF